MDLRVQHPGPQILALTFPSSVTLGKIVSLSEFPSSLFLLFFRIFIYLPVPALGCGMWIFSCSMWDLIP